MATRKTIRTPVAETPAPAKKPKKQANDPANNDALKNSMNAATVAPVATAPPVARDDDDAVQVNVPNSFNLTLADYRTIRYEALVTRSMPREHAEHPYAKANGVTILNK